MAMALVFIPTMFQKLTNGTAQVRVEGKTLRELLTNLDEVLPGLREHLVPGGQFRNDLVVAIDGEVAIDLTDRVGENSEVHFIPPIAGG
jgi:molybdopterin converting factor small subunit